jgi:hypothetical protein
MGTRKKRFVQEEVVKMEAFAAVEVGQESQDTYLFSV